MPGLTIFSPAVAGLLNELAACKVRHGLTFVIIAAVTAGALVPELFLIVFFQSGRPARQNLRNLLFTVPIWAIDGSLVDLLYRGQAAWLGNVVTLPVVLAKSPSTNLVIIRFSPRPLASLLTSGKIPVLAWSR